ncbi:MAG: DUF4239 domain-containing protein [Acidimicrobiales bacterium]
MAEWLVRTVPTGVLTLLILGVLGSVAIGGCLLFRRVGAGLRDSVSDDVAGIIVSILAGVYGIVLAFVVVVLWEDLQSAQQVVSTEANSLAQLVEDSHAFPAPTEAGIRDGVNQYVHAVANDEWGRMQDGEESTKVAAAIEQLYGVMRGFQPSAGTQESFYQQASSNLDQVAASRRERLRLSRRGLPGIIQLFSFGGALVVIFFTYFFAIESEGAHVLLCAGVALVLGFTLLVCLLLMDPFSGSISVKRTIFQEGVLSAFWR